MRSTKIIKICSSSLRTYLHHMVILRTRNKITDFLMILAWASPLKLSLVLYNDTLAKAIVPTPVKRGQHCTMYYTHLYGEDRKLIILLYRVFEQ